LWLLICVNQHWRGQVGRQLRGKRETETKMTKDSPTSSWNRGSRRDSRCDDGATRGEGEKWSGRKNQKPKPKTKMGTTRMHRT